MNIEDVHNYLLSLGLDKEKADKACSVIREFTMDATKRAVGQASLQQLDSIIQTEQEYRKKILGG